MQISSGARRLLVSEEGYYSWDGGLVLSCVPIFHPAQQAASVKGALGTTVTGTHNSNLEQ